MIDTEIMKKLMMVALTMLVSVSSFSNSLPDPKDPEASRYAYDSTLCEAFRVLASPSFKFEEEGKPNDMVCYATEWSIKLVSEGSGYKVYTFRDKHTRSLVIASYINGKLASVEYL